MKQRGSLSRNHTLIRGSICRNVSFIPRGSVCRNGGSISPEQGGQYGPEYTLWLLFKTTIVIDENPLTDLEQFNNKNLIEFNRNEKLRNSYKSLLFDRLTQLAKKHSFISIDELESILQSTSDCIPCRFSIIDLKIELNRLSQMFFENSYVNCFSECKNDFLMWSHYASKHSGICLEFTLDKHELFPFKKTGLRIANNQKYLQKISNWNINETILWEKIYKVKYQDNQPHINFFEFAPVINNEYDCDLIGLSKSWTHNFARELESVFSTKTLPWAYEKEWRAIIINFKDKKEPEERISYYPIECLTGIYFGIRTPEDVKKRVFKIFDRHHSQNIKYYTCIPTSGRELTFSNWEYFHE